MRLTPEQVRERFEREVKPDVCHCDQHGSRHVVPVEMAIAFAQLVARDLQAPPTGEEVEFAAACLNDAVDDLRRGCLDTRENLAAHVGERIRDYGSACAAAARAESGNREPTDDTESEAFCALKNRLTDLLNSHGHYREMTAYQGALERYREAVASEARRRSRKAADVLKRLETALANDTTLPTVHLEELGTYFHCKIVECAGARRTVEVAEKTLEGAIAAAIDQLARWRCGRDDCARKRNAVESDHVRTR